MFKQYGELADLIAESHQAQRTTRPKGVAAMSTRASTPDQGALSGSARPVGNPYPPDRVRWQVGRRAKARRTAHRSSHAAIRPARRQRWLPSLATAVVALLLAACVTRPSSSSSSAAGPSDPGSSAPSAPGTSRLQVSTTSAMAGQRFFVAWGPIRPSAAATWKAEGFTGAYKLIGDFAWAKVEPRPGHFDFSTWRDDQAVLRSHGLFAFPSLEFLKPPAWFIAQHPDSVVEYGARGTPPSIDHLSTHCVECGRGNVPSLSLAWLDEQAQEHTAAWKEFKSYLTASLRAMTSDPSVIGVAFPWLAFKERDALGKWPAMEHDPSSVLLGDFNPASLATWPGPGEPPATLAQLLAGGSALEHKWEAWTEHREGAAFVSIAELLHSAAPRLWISLDKFVWIRMSDRSMHPVLALADGTTATAFSDFLVYVRRFVTETGDNRVILDDDALMDPSKDANFELTERLIRPLGLSFMGESQPGPAGIAGLLRSVVAIHPDAVVFLPAPGRGGGWVKSSPDAQAVICLVRSRYQDHGCLAGSGLPSGST